MKRLNLLLILFMLLILPGVSSAVYAQQSGFGFTSSPAEPPDQDGDGLLDADDQCPTKAGPRTNGGCPEDDSSADDSDSKPDGGSKPSDDPNRDSDGDGLSDKDDRCPTVGGHVDNGGCPPDGSPNPDITPEPPTFRPPALPTDRCYVTPLDDYKVNVRKVADGSADVIGHLLPGTVYPAIGYVMVGADFWLVMTSYEGSTGTIGYSSRTVLLVGNCPQIAPPFVGTGLQIFERPDDLVKNPLPDQPTLCHMTVGFDAPTWATDPAMESVWYASFYFEQEPGTPLLAGTPIWGVVSVAPYITLEDHSNVVAMVTDPAIFEAAQNAPYAGAYNWPTMSGGVQSGSQLLYRFTDNVNVEGACGEIVAIDDLASESNPTNPTRLPAGDQPVIDGFACTISLGNWLFAFGYEPGKRIPLGTNPIAILNGDMQLAGDINNWYTGLKADAMGELVQIMEYPGWALLPRTGGDCGPISGSVDSNDPISSIPNQSLANAGDGNDDPGVIAMQCQTKPGTTLLDSCWCYQSDDSCINQLAYFCNGYSGVAHIETDDDKTYCQFGDSANTQIVVNDCNLNGIEDLAEYPTPKCLDDLTIGEGDNPPPTRAEIFIFDMGDGSRDGDGPEDYELDFLWEQCPDGWVWYEDTGLECEPLIIED